MSVVYDPTPLDLVGSGATADEAREALKAKFIEQVESGRKGKLGRLLWDPFRIKYTYIPAWLSRPLVADDQERDLFSKILPLPTSHHRLDLDPMNVAYYVKPWNVQAVYSAADSLVAELARKAAGEPSLIARVAEVKAKTRTPGVAIRRIAGALRPMITQIIKSGQVPSIPACAKDAASLAAARIIYSGAQEA